MGRSSALSIAILSCLYGSVLAAPSLALPSPNSVLNILNVTSATFTSDSAADISVTRPFVGTTFPPGTEPPGEVFFYDVPRSDPRMNIKFLSVQGGLWPHTGDPNASNVQGVIQEAFHDAEVPSKRNVVMDQESIKNEWSYGRNYLWISPYTIKEPPLIELTWGMWADALRGINQFRLAYPGLLVIFQIYVYPAVGPRTREVECYVGHGALQFGTDDVAGAGHAQSKRTQKLG